MTTGKKPTISTLDEMKGVLYEQFNSIYKYGPVNFRGCEHDAERAIAIASVAQAIAQIELAQAEKEKPAKQRSPS